MAITWTFPKHLVFGVTPWGPGVPSAILATMGRSVAAFNGEGRKLSGEDL